MARKTEVYMKSAEGNVFATCYPEYHQECERLTQAEGKRLYREQTRKSLLKWIKPGMTIYTKVNSVSRSGMSRNISLYAIIPAKKGEPARLANISYSASVVIGETLKDGGLQVSGCGMDMCFQTVYTLGHYLWPKGTKKAHSTRNGEPDNSGGYALKKEDIS